MDDAKPQTISGLSCIVCGQQAVERFLDLGSTALANKFLTTEELSKPEAKYPLRVGFCHTCGHVQLTEEVPPSAMFEDYLYVSSASDTLKAHLFDLSDIVVKRRNLGTKDFVIDIGCNDGTLLTGFKRHGVKTLGVDPAQNLADLTKNNGIERYVGFFNSKTAREILAKWGPASAMTATNTFPHIPALQDFVEGINIALAPGGAFVIEAHYLVDILEQCAFDTIYHEHISYWALGPMMYLFEKHGMQVVNAERLPLHHGQLRVTVQRKGEGAPQASVGKILESERRLGLDKIATYRQFAQKTLQLKADLQRTLKELRVQGKRVVGYGAPAKGNTLLGFLEIDPSLIEYIADKSALKQGRFCPGVHIPVVPPDQLLKDQPDYVVLLAWNFVDEILTQQNEYVKRGGKFIVPVPAVKILP
jgi:SAM-dependent methyltransferase